MADGVSPTKVVVRYKPYGAPEWKTIDMKKLRRGYGIEIPCAEVGSTVGDLKYYVQAIGSEGEVLAFDGSKTSPLRVSINTEISGDPPHLPGRRPPRQCSGSAATECPPEFPGCKLGKKGTGKACGVGSDCPSGMCGAGRCVEDDDAVKKPCESDSGCKSGYLCKAGYCEANPKKNWIALALQQDFVILPGAKDVCLNQTVYACMQGNGTYYEPGQTVPIQGSRDEVKAGLAVATTRVLLAYDRPVTSNLALGGRLGYAFGGGPDSRTGSSFLPVHVEARASLWFGTDPFIKTGMRPYLVASVGVAQIDASVSVQVDVKAADMTTQSGTLIAWKRSGALFASGGFGLFYALGRSTGFFGEVRAQRMFPDAGTAIPIQIGYAVGI
jgi:hypothetical protein